MHLSSVLSRSGAKSKSTTSAKFSPASHVWDGTFFIYDRTGKEKLLTEAVLGLRSQDRDLPKISQIIVADIPALKIERVKGTTYWVETGKYATSANERSVLEEILPRLLGKSSSSASLAQSAAYQEALPLLKGGLLEFYFAIPNAKDLSYSSPVAGFNAGPVLQAMKLDSMHSFCGHMTFEGSRTRLQGALLGNAAPGTLFDIFASGDAQPASLSFLSSDTISYSDIQTNLPGIYDTLKRTLASALPPAQQGAINMVEMLAQAKIGMPLRDALDMFTGDISSLNTQASIDPKTTVYTVGIRRKPYMLKLHHAPFSARSTFRRTQRRRHHFSQVIDGRRAGKRWSCAMEFHSSRGHLEFYAHQR